MFVLVVIAIIMIVVIIRGKGYWAEKPEIALSPGQPELKEM